MPRTLGQQLTTIQEAIQALESGRVSSYEVEGREIEYLNISTLYTREEYLLGQIDVHGSEYTPGLNKRPQSRSALVSFA